MKKGFGEFFKDSLNEYRDKFIPVLKSFAFLYLIPTIVLLLIGVTSVFIILGSVVSENISLDNISEQEIFDILKDNLSSGDISLLVFIGLVLILGYFVISLLSSLVYIHLGFSKKADFKESFRKSRSDFWRYLGFTVVMSIFMFVLFMLLIIPGIIFMVYWVFAVFVFINERKGIIDSLKTSFNLVRGRWWITFGYVLLLMIIAGALSQVAIFIPFGSLLINLVIPPFMILFMKNYYLEVKKSKK